MLTSHSSPTKNNYTWRALATNQRSSNSRAAFQLLQSRTVAVFDWSYFIAWVGVGWVLVSALLFVGASVCLKRETYSEKRKNLPYIMPGRSSRRPA